MQKLLISMVLFLGAYVYAQNENGYAELTSCQLAVTTSVYSPDTADRFGKAMAEVTLTDESGLPIPNQPIQMTTSCGIFSCLPPENLTDAGLENPLLACFTTGSDGKMVVYIVKIPFNSKGLVKASFTWGNTTIKASGNFLITRSVSKIKKKKTKVYPIPLVPGH
jgi:hypothetical protein